MVKTWLPKEFPSFFVNIVLHGLENYIKEWIIQQKWQTTQRHQRDTANKIQSITIVRYLEKFVIIHSDKTIVQKAKEATLHWLTSELHLNFNAGETKSLVSSREGFEFLNFQFISIYFQNTYRTKIYPSKETQKNIVKSVGDICKRYRAISTYDLIGILRPRLLSWENYYRFCECKTFFNKIDRQIFQILRSWVFRRDRRHGRTAVKQKYFPIGRNFNFDNRQYINNWVLCASQKSKNDISEERFLPKLAWIQSSKFIKIRGNVSP